MIAGLVVFGTLGTDQGVPNTAPRRATMVSQRLSLQQGSGKVDAFAMDRE